MSATAYDQTDVDSQPVLLRPGAYFLVIRNTDAGGALSIGKSSAAALVGSARTKSGLGALGATLDLSTGWSGSGARVAGGLQFILAGEATLV